MDPTQFSLVTQPAGQDPFVSMPVQEQPGAPSLRPGPSTFPDASFDPQGFRKDRAAVPALRVQLKAKTPQGRYAAWAFEVCPAHTVAELKARVALFVAHRLWGGAYRVRGWSFFFSVWFVFGGSRCGSCSVRMEAGRFDRIEA